MILRCLAVDDEPPARDLLRMMLRDVDDVELVGECGNGRQAVSAIKELMPDVVFLDIQMPHLDGFDVLRELHPASLPAIVFTTAYDQYAVKAFETNAIDYLLKPFDEDRLVRAVERARDRLLQRDRAEVNRQLMTAVEIFNAGRHDRRRLTVREGDRTYLHRVEDVDWVEADTKNVRIHIGKRTHTMRETMKAMEERLAGGDFLRVSRSAIVNLDRIREIQPWFNGDYVIILRDGTEITTTKGYRDELARLVGRRG